MILSAELEAPISSETSSTTPVKNIEFSNKGINMAVSWSGQDICRVYSLHKKFMYIDAITEGSAVQTLSFDQYG